MTTPKERERLVSARSERHLSQRRMAVFLGIAQTHYREIEAGRRNPSLPVAFRMSNRLGVSIEELFGDLAETG